MADYKGLTIKFEGDATSLSAALHKISEDSRKAEGELTGINRALKFDPTNVKLLGAQIQESANKYDALRKRADSFRQAIENENKSVAEARDRMRELAEAGQQDSEEFRELAQSVEKSERVIARMSLEAEKAEAEMRQLSDSIWTTRTKLEATESGLWKFATKLETVGSVANAAADALLPVAERMTAISVAAVGFIGRRVVSETEDFGNAMSQVGVYLGVTGDDLEHMGDLALYWGKETRYSATEAAQAMSELAKGGLSAVEIEGGAMAATMDLAAAGQMDLADAALTVAQSMRAFGLEAGNTTEIADALAGVANGTTSTVEGLASGFRYVAGWSRLSSWDIHEVSGALGLLADYGLQGEMAGTALRNVLMRLAAPTDKAKGIMESYGIEVRDANGQMKSAVEVIDELNKAFEGVDEDERDAALNTMFGARGINAASALMDAGSDVLQEYIDLTGQAGAASEMAQGQLGDLGWALEYLRGEAETAAVNFGEALTPMLIDAANAAEDLLSRFNELDDTSRGEVVGNFLKLVAVGPALLGVATALKGIGSASIGLAKAGKFVSAFSAVSGNVSSGASLATKLGLAMTTVSGDATAMSTNIAKAGIALTGLKVAAGIALVAVVALGAYAIWKHFDDARKRTEKLNTAMSSLSDASRDTGRRLSNAAGDADSARISLRELREETDALADAHIELAVSFKEQNEQLAGNVSQLKWARDTVIKYQGDMAEGVELSTEAQGDLNTALQILQSQYGITFEVVEGALVMYDDEGEAVDLTKEKIYELCDAKMYEMQVNAMSEQYSETYKQRESDVKDLAEATEAQAAAQEELNELYAKYGITDPNRVNRHNVSREDYDRIKELEGQVEEYGTRIDSLNESIEDGDLALENYSYRVGALTAASEGADLSLGQLVATNDDLMFALQTNGVNISEFGKALDESGLDAEKTMGILESLSDDQLTTLMSQFDGTSASVRNSLGFITGDLGSFTDTWSSEIHRIADEYGISTDDVIAAINRCIDEGTVTAGSSAAELGRAIRDNIYDEATRQDELAALKESFKKDGYEAVRSFDGGVNTGMTRATKRIDARGLARNILRPFGLEFERANSMGWGANLMARFKSGLVAVDVAGTASAKALQVKNGLGSDSYTWGYHLMQNFAKGMAAYDISSAAKSAADKVAAYMHFTVPEKGPLSDEDKWGGHLVQNFAEGMRRSLPELEQASLAMAEAIQQPTLDYDEGSFLTEAAENARLSRQTNIYFNGISVNDSPAIRDAFIGLMYEANRVGAMSGGRR